MFWKATNVEAEEERTLANMFQTGFGDAIHQWFFDKLKLIETIKIQSELSGRLTIDGLTRELSYRLDGIANVSGERIGVELKTTQGRALDKMNKEGGPKEHHILQVFDYFLANPDISKFVLIYVSRDSGFSSEYLIEKKEDGFHLSQTYPSIKELRKIEGVTIEGMKARRQELEQAIDTNSLPPRDYSVFLNKDGEIQEFRQKAGEKYKSDFWCLYCDYSKRCWSMPDAKESEKKIK
jgi:hypothetical protein